MSDSFLKNPARMTDDELEREWRAVHGKQYLSVLESDEVPDYVKEKFIEQKEKVAKELQRRKREDWMYPLSSFGIVDFD